MKTKPFHAGCTPGEWMPCGNETLYRRVVNTDEFRPISARTIEAENFGRIAAYWDYSNEPEENFARILHCVNMYNELVETLSYCKDWIERNGLDKATLMDGTLVEVLMLTTIKKVLEKASQ